MSKAPRGRLRRDLVIMSLIGLMTIGGIAVAAELLARTRFYELPTGLAVCLTSDPQQGVKGIPHCKCREKSLESPEIEYRLDSRGYRSDVELAAKAPDVYRIVFIGSSVAMGERTELEQSAGALLVPRLAALSGRKIEVYNEAMGFGFARNTELRFQDAIDMNPDLILWIVTPLDLARSEETLARNPDAALPEHGVQSLKAKVLESVRERGGTVVLGQVLRHSLYELQSADQYIHAALQGRTESDETGFLLANQGPTWNGHWTDFTGHANDMFTRAHDAGITMAVAYAPNRVEAAMISAGKWPAGYDPYAIDTRLRDLVRADQGVFIELLPHYREVVGAEHMFLPIDGHPTVAGYAFLAVALGEEMARAPTLHLTAAIRQSAP
jgi:hypothetical protein